ncbi:hypothetical protein CCYA_CCYA14G3766 [Cyanidiococcus yangmingshanensis]|nr:hypothetical protein CCYA_CCYA14G3766 [Cyanidiococcus yangmingshanensis]
MPGHQHVRLASERLGEVLATVLSTDAALREDDRIRDLFLLLSDGTASPANVFIHLRFERDLAERIRRAEGAAFRAILVVLHLLLEGPLEALAEAVANGMLDYWQALYRLWSERLPNAESMSEAEAAEHWRTIFLVEVIDYLTRKLRFHESYPVFEANYSLGRFLRRADLEAIDAARAAENRETMQRVFSLDTVTEMVSILHRLLDAELGLARHVGVLDSKAPPNGHPESNESLEAPETRAVFGLYREPTLLRSLLSLLASDAASLYQMIVYMMSRMYEQIGRRGGTGNTRTEEVAELRELAVVLQEMGVFLRKFFERLLDADLVEEVPHIPSQLLMPAPDASMVASRFPFLIVGRFTTFDCLHRAIAPGSGLEAPERLRSA